MILEYTKHIDDVTGWFMVILVYRIDLILGGINNNPYYWYLL
jgi:hypothetical protein